MLQISGVGSLLAGINFIVMFLKCCHGMTLMRCLYSSGLFLCDDISGISIPSVNRYVRLVTLDRTMDMHFFTEDMGGNIMMYINLIWAWGHLRSIFLFYVFAFFQRLLQPFQASGYNGGAIAIIAFLAFIVWLHHLIFMGAGANVNAFFA